MSQYVGDGQSYEDAPTRDKLFTRWGQLKSERAERPRPGVVVDVVVASVALVAVLAEVAAVARQDVGGEFLPVRVPRRTFGLQLPPASEQLVPRRGVLVGLGVACVLAHQPPRRVARPSWSCWGLTPIGPVSMVVDGPPSMPAPCMI